jgi:hypothetical protein
VTSVVDRYTTLPGKALKYVEQLPAAIVLDFASVKLIDLTSLVQIDEITAFARSKYLLFK